ncbi:hypothetical protein EW026_g111 [Hermanssonia centrifuga]|uniref:Threonine/serine exporter-like N-terminal domain-containing protein n=1 Tax=Hermanssonia centrifuga TaxID=98765 RepID=A0A4S4KVQ0_9APHY|nr:hypothetical protein EW026_g111 [Hermanssonia centrifuga]
MDELEAGLAKESSTTKRPSSPSEERGFFSSLCDADNDWNDMEEEAPDEDPAITKRGLDDTLYEQVLDPDDPIVTGKHKESEPDRDETERDVWRQMSYRQRRKERMKMKVEYNVSSVVNREKFLMKLGKALMTFGAPSHRIESQLLAAARILELQAEFIHVPGLIMCSFTDKESKSSETHFIKCGGRVTLGRLHEVHQIYRAVVHDELSAKRAGDMLGELLVAKPIYSALKQCILAFWIAALICPLAFGGSFIDMWVAGAGAIFLSFMRVGVISKGKQFYANVFEVCMAILISFTARALSSIHGQIFCYNAISSASIVSSLPGFLILSGSLELASKNIMCGSVKMVYALIYTLFLGFGLQIGNDVYLLFDRPARHALDQLAGQLYTQISQVGIFAPDNGTFTFVNNGKPLAGTFTFLDVNPFPQEHIVTGCFRSADFPWYLQPFPWWSQFIIVPIFSILSSLANLQPIWTYDMVVMVVISCAAYAANKSANHYILNRSDIVSAIGAFVVGILGNFYSRKMGGTAFTVMVTGVLFLVPSGLSAVGGITAQGNGIDIGGAMIAVTIGITLIVYRNKMSVTDAEDQIHQVVEQPELQHHEDVQYTAVPDASTKHIFEPFAYEHSGSQHATSASEESTVDTAERVLDDINSKDDQDIHEDIGDIAAAQATYHSLPDENDTSEATATDNAAEIEDGTDALGASLEDDAKLEDLLVALESDASKPVSLETTDVDDAARKSETKPASEELVAPESSAPVLPESATAEEDHETSSAVTGADDRADLTEETATDPFADPVSPSGGESVIVSEDAPVRVADEAFVSPKHVQEDLAEEVQQESDAEARVDQVVEEVPAEDAEPEEGVTLSEPERTGHESTSDQEATLETTEFEGAPLEEAGPEEDAAFVADDITKNEDAPAREAVDNPKQPEEALTEEDQPEEDVAPADKYKSEDVAAADEYKFEEDVAPTEEYKFEEEVSPADQYKSEEDAAAVDEYELEGDVAPTEEHKFEEEVAPTEEHKFEEDVSPADQYKSEEDIAATGEYELEEDVAPTAGYKFEEEVSPADQYKSEEDVAAADEYELEEDVAPTEEHRFEEEVSPADEYKSDEDIVAADEYKLEEDVVPTDEYKPEEDVAPTDESKPEEDVAAADEYQLEEDVVPADESKPEEDVVPTGEYDPEDIAPAEEDIPKHEEAPIEPELLREVPEEELPEEIEPAEESNPAHEESLIQEAAIETEDSEEANEVDESSVLEDTSTVVEASQEVEPTDDVAVDTEVKQSGDAFVPSEDVNASAEEPDVEDAISQTHEIAEEPSAEDSQLTGMNFSAEPALESITRDHLILLSSSSETCIADADVAIDEPEVLSEDVVASAEDLDYADEVEEPQSEVSYSQVDSEDVSAYQATAGEADLEHEDLSENIIESEAPVVSEEPVTGTEGADGLKAQSLDVEASDLSSSIPEVVDELSTAETPAVDEEVTEVISEPIFSAAEPESKTVVKEEEITSPADVSETHEGTAVPAPEESSINEDDEITPSIDDLRQEPEEIPLVLSAESNIPTSADVAEDVDVPLVDFSELSPPSEAPEGVPEDTAGPLDVEAIQEIEPPTKVAQEEVAAPVDILPLMEKPDGNSAIEVADLDVSSPAEHIEESSVPSVSAHFEEEPVETGPSADAYVKEEVNALEVEIPPIETTPDEGTESETPVGEDAPTIAVTDEDSGEPAHIPDVTPVVELEAERPRSPWTPSYSVITQGPGTESENVADDAEIAELDQLPPPIEKEVSETEVPLTNAVEADEEQDEVVATVSNGSEADHRTWPVSYSVSSQGASPLAATPLHFGEAPAVSVLSGEESVPDEEGGDAEAGEPGLSVEADALEIVQDIPSVEHLVPNEDPEEINVGEPELAPESIASSVLEEIVPVEQFAPQVDVVEASEPELEREGDRPEVTEDILAPSSIVITSDETEEEPTISGFDTTDVDPLANEHEQNAAPERPWTPSYSVSRQGSSPLQTPKELEELEEPPSATLVDQSGERTDPERPWTPSYSVSRQGTISPAPDAAGIYDSEAFGKVSPTILSPEIVIAEEDIPAADATASESQATADRSDSGPLQTPRNDIVQLPESADSQPGRPWTPSYSVSRQGSSPMLESQVLTSESFEEATHDLVEEPVQTPVISIQDENEEPKSVLEEPSVNDSSSTDIPAQAHPQIVEASEKRPGSPWTPSYSVSRQGSPAASPALRPKEIEAEESQDEPAFETTEVTEVEERQPEIRVDAAAESGDKPERPWTPSYSVITQGPSSPSQDSDAVSNGKIERQAFPSMEIAENGPELIAKPSLARLAPLNEREQIHATSPAELDPTGLIAPRARIESTTSSRFFPGGWFSSASPKSPDDIRTSLDHASGEFSRIDDGSEVPVNTPIDGVDGEKRNKCYEVRRTYLFALRCDRLPRSTIRKDDYSEGYTDFSSLPNFPFIGGVQGVSWNSTLCGSCWELTYNGTTINVLAVDYAAAGFNIALEALDQLTYDQAVALGHVDAEFEQVSGTKCGLPA